MPPPSLASLAFELKLEIVSQVNDAKDLKSLALVSKEFHEAVAPKQFRRLDLFLIDTEDFDTFLAGALTGSNIHHTRYLHIRAKGNVDGSLEKVASLLPADILHRFELAYGTKITLKSFFQIWQRQLELRTILVPALSNSSAEILNGFMAKKSERAGSKLEEIKIRGDISTWKETCSVAQALIKIAGNKLKRLKIMPFTHWENSSVSGVYGPVDKLGPVPTVLFQHMIKNPSCQPLVLTHLTLDNMPLDCSEMFMNNVIDFQLLSDLRIRRCAKATEFLAALTPDANNSPHMVMHLKYFEFAEYYNEEMEVVEAFLQSFKGLEHLYLIFHKSISRPDPLCIIQHADTLTLLVVETDTTNEEDVESTHDCYTLEDIKMLTSACTMLQQLSIELPPQDVDDHQIPMYGFGDLCNGYLDHILSLRNLRILNLKYSSECLDGSANIWAWHGLANKIADSIYKQVKFLNLNLFVVAIGACSTQKFDTGPNGDMEVGRLLYVSATLKDSLGHARVCANEVSMRSLKDTGMQMDLLKYRSPWW